MKVRNENGDQIRSTRLRGLVQRLILDSCGHARVEKVVSWNASLTRTSNAASAALIVLEVNHLWDSHALELLGFAHG